MIAAGTTPVSNPGVDMTYLTQRGWVLVRYKCQIYIYFPICQVPHYKLCYVRFVKGPGIRTSQSCAIPARPKTSDANPSSPPLRVLQDAGNVDLIPGLTRESGQHDHVPGYRHDPNLSTLYDPRRPLVFLARALVTLIPG